MKRLIEMLHRCLVAIPIRQAASVDEAPKKPLSDSGISLTVSPIANTSVDDAKDTIIYASDSSIYIIIKIGKASYQQS